MYRNLRLLAVVPARGGSKGIPLKNIQPVLGLPIVARVAELLNSMDCFDCSIISSDNESIIEVASEYGLEAPFRRPESLSGDRIGDYDVLLHALNEAEAKNSVEYDAIVMLQPTSPLRRAHHIMDALDLFVEGNYDAVWSVSKSDTKNHPLKQLKLEDDKLSYYDSRGSKIIARQQLETLYQRNGIVYVVSRACLTEQKSIKGARTGAYIVTDPSVSIDTLEDIDYVEFLMSKYGDPLRIDQQSR
ncbi:MAG: cytidylyltransferase domain-containing protein [bacterium]